MRPFASIVLGVVRAAAGSLLAAWLLGCAAPTAPPVGAAADAGPAVDDDDRLIIVAVVDRPDPWPGAGATPRADYRHAAGYGGGAQAAALAAEVARDHRLEPRLVVAGRTGLLRRDGRVRCLLGVLRFLLGFTRAGLVGREPHSALTARWIKRDKSS